MYTYGNAKSGGKLTQIDPNTYDYPPNEVGVLINGTWACQAFLFSIPDEHAVCEEFKRQLESKGCTVTYMKARTEVDWGTVVILPGVVIIRLIIERMEFTAKGLAPVIWAAIIIGIVLAGALITLSFMILYPGIMYKWAGVTAGEAGVYNVAQALNYIVLFIALITVGGIIWLIYKNRDKIPFIKRKY